MAEERASPLVQVNAAPSTVRPKVIAIYDQLFTADQQPPGYWVEFFILPVSPGYLRQYLASVPRREALEKHVVMRTLIAAAIANISGKDTYVAKNSLGILEIFLEWVLTLNLSSSELIDVIAGLETVETVVDDLADVIVMRLESPATAQNALDVLELLAAAVSGTSLAPFFVRNNFFTPLAKTISARGDAPISRQAFALIGIIANLDKFSDHVDANTERVRDFIDSAIVQQMADLAGTALTDNLKLYKSSSSQLKTWLRWFTSQPDNTVDMSALPDPSIAVVLPVYEFALHNGLFAATFVKSGGFLAFLELASYMAQATEQTSRAQSYSRLMLLVLRQVVESRPTFNLLVDPQFRGVVSVAQIKTPPFPSDTSPRLRIEGVVDVLQCFLRYSLRKNTDYALYELVLTILFQAIAYSREIRQPLPYNWPELWQTLGSLLKHLKSETKKTDDAKSQGRGTASLILLVFAACLLEPQLFEQDDYWSLFSRTVKESELVQEVAKKYKFSSDAHVAVIMGMAAHYDLLISQSEDFSSSKIKEVVKQGHHALSLVAKSHSSVASGLLINDKLPRYQEGSERAFLKRVTRVVVSDLEKKRQASPNGGSPSEKRDVPSPRNSKSIVSSPAGTGRNSIDN